MSQVEVDGYELALKLIIQDVIFTIAVHIDVHVVTTEGVAERRPGEAAGMDGEVATYHQTLA